MSTLVWAFSAQSYNHSWSLEESYSQDWPLICVLESVSYSVVTRRNKFLFEHVQRSKCICR